MLSTHEIAFPIPGKDRQTKFTACDDKSCAHPKGFTFSRGWLDFETCLKIEPSGLDELPLPEGCFECGILLAATLSVSPPSFYLMLSLGPSSSPYPKEKRVVASRKKHGSTKVANGSDDGLESDSRNILSYGHASPDTPS